jgi:hypothetical protein
VNGEVLWAIVADGAGSAKFGELGAEIVCNGFANRIERWLTGRGGHVDELDLSVIKKWVGRVHRELDHFAKHNNAHLRDYACTLLGIIVGNDCTVCFQVGDGGIVVGYREEEYDIVFWPENGEYANTTHFFTDQAMAENLHVKMLAYTPQHIALFTDGIQRLALHFATQSVFAPFFAPMFKRLSAESLGHAAHLEPELQAFLNSPRVNERTDDDKTLVLAMRHELAQPENLISQ